MSLFRSSHRAVKHAVGSNFGINYFNLLRSLRYSKNPNENPVSAFHHRTCQASKHRGISHFFSARIGLCKSIHSLEETRFLVEPTDEKLGSESRLISQETERICRILSVQRPDSGIASSLDGAGISVSPALVAEVLRRLSNAGMLAFAFFRWAEKQDGFKHATDSFHHLIEALGKIKQFRLIWSLVETMRVQGLLTKETFVLITRRYARARKIKEATEAFEKMAVYGLKPELSDYNSFIDTLSKSKHVKRAQEICNDLKKRKKFTPDLKTYSILLEGWGHERDLTMLKTVYREMIDEGFEPDAVTYGILINAYCRSRKIDEALKIFDQMQASNCRPTPHIYCTLINGLGSEMRLEEALKFFERSKASGFPPELPTYNALVGAYCWALRFDDASEVMDAMKRCGIGPNARSYDILLHHLIKARRLEEAYRIFQRMSKEPTCQPQLNTYTMVVTMFCAEGRVDMALKVWNQMTEKGILPCMHMFSSLINGLCYENRLDDACQYFQEMLDKGIRPPGQLYSNLKEALLEEGKKDMAFDLGLKLDKLRKTPLSG